MKKIYFVFRIAFWFLSFSIIIAQSASSANESHIEGLPILMYDTDIGVGYGAKVFFLNQFNMNESFDLTLFNSTKGERWYRFVFSLPDFELRQRTTYPLAIDLFVDYDKMIKNSFFGIGNDSPENKREYYTKEPIEITINLSSGFSETFVGQIGFRYKSVRNYNFDEFGFLKDLPSSINYPKAYYSSALINLRYDTRNSFINPSEGMLISGEIESANKTLNSNYSFIKWSALFQYYYTLWHPQTIFAFRLITEHIAGEDLPIQSLLSIGGTKTLRGSPIDRFVDRGTALINAEFRFPIYKRLGGLIAFDAGQVFPSFKKLRLDAWSANPTLGLRFFMDTFIARLDIGFGKETTGLYFNFGHLF